MNLVFTTTYRGISLDTVSIGIIKCLPMSLHGCANKGCVSVTQRAASLRKDERSPLSSFFKISEFVQQFRQVCRIEFGPPRFVSGLGRRIRTAQNTDRLHARCFGAGAIRAPAGTKCAGLSYRPWFPICIDRVQRAARTS